MPKEEFQKLSFIPLPLIVEGDKYADLRISMERVSMKRIISLLHMVRKWTGSEKRSLLAVRFSVYYMY